MVWRGLRSSTETDFPRPVRSVRRQRLAATVFARNEHVNGVLIRWPKNRVNRFCDFLRFNRFYRFIEIIKWIFSKFWKSEITDFSDFQNLFCTNPIFWIGDWKLITGIVWNRNKKPRTRFATIQMSPNKPRDVARNLRNLNRMWKVASFFD